jgi:hypothetical protein
MNGKLDREIALITGAGHGIRRPCAPNFPEHFIATTIERQRPHIMVNDARHHLNRTREGE